eukprot:scaffold1221_cov207-Amphora_coffeaeformis.AAC.43
MSNVRPRVARPCERTPKNADLTEATKEVTTTAMRSFSTTSDLFRLSRINNPSFLLVEPLKRWHGSVDGRRHGEQVNVLWKRGGPLPNKPGRRTRYVTSLGSKIQSCHCIDSE